MNLSSFYKLVTYPIKALGAFLFTDDDDKYNFVRVWSICFFPSFAGAIIASLFGVSDVALFLFVVSILVSPILAALATLVARYIGGAAGGLYYSGSRELDKKKLLEALLAKASGQGSSGDYLAAEATYREVIDEYPENPIGPYMLGRLYDKGMDDLGRAFVQYGIARKILRTGDHADFQYRNNLITEYQALKEYLE